MKFSIVAITFLVCLFVAFKYIPHAVVIWDEATHMKIAYTMYTHLKNGEIIAYIDYIFHQTGYPPLLPFVSSVVFLFTGFSIATARYWNLVWFFFSTILVYVLGVSMGFGTEKKRTGSSIGMIGSFLFLTSPFIILLSSLYMREGISITMSLVTILIYFKARETDSRTYYIATGLALFFIIMAKYNLGAIIAVSIAIEQVIVRKRMMTNTLFLFLPCLFLFVLWMSYPAYKIPGFIRFMTDPIRYTSGQSFWTYILYYPIAIVLTYSFSKIIGLLLLSTFLLSVRFVRNYKVRTAWIIVAVNLILAGMHSNNLQERYIATSIPFLFLIASYAFVYFFAKIPWRRRTIRILYSILFVVFGAKILIDFVGLPSYIYAISTHTFRTPLFNQLDYEDTHFIYDTNRWNKPLPPEDAEKPQDVVDFIIKSVDLSKPVWIDGYSNELSPGYFDMLFAFAREKQVYSRLPHTSYVVTIEVLPTSRYYTYDYRIQNTWQIANIRYRESDPALIKVTEKLFDELQIRVVIYGKT